MKMKSNTPYVYIVKNLTTGLKYIGCQYGKKADPNNLWKKYFTSSKLVKKLIEVYGKEDFQYRIIKIFDNDFSTLEYERKLLTIAIYKDDYLNLHKNFVHSSEEKYLLHKTKMKKIHTFYGKLQAILKIGFHGISEEDRLKNCSRGGLAAGKINKENGTGIFDPEVRKRQHKTLKEKQISAFYDPILRKEIASTGGKNGLFSKNYSERNGISDEERKKAQSERGKLGGPKNKGFRWYNDGIKDYKYSPREQEKIQFDEFIKNNQQFKPSRKPIKGYNKNNEHEDQKNN